MTLSACSVPTSKKTPAEQESVFRFLPDTTFLPLLFLLDSWKQRESFEKFLSTKLLFLSCHVFVSCLLARFDRHELLSCLGLPSLFGV
jgi:hypothetical protein